MNLDPLLKGHFLNLYHMALSDAEVDTSELEKLYTIGAEKGISKVEIDLVVLRPDTIKFSAPSSVLEKIESLFDLARIALADGKIDENEQRVLHMFCKKFGFEEENLDTLVEFLLNEAKKGTSKADIFKIVSENL